MARKNKRVRLTELPGMTSSTDPRYLRDGPVWGPGPLSETMGGRYAGSKKLETHRGPSDEVPPGPHHAGPQLPSAMPRSEEKVSVAGDEAIVDQRIIAQRRQAADTAGLRVKTTKNKK